MEDEKLDFQDYAVNDTLARLRIQKQQAYMKRNYKQYAAIPVIDELARTVGAEALSLINPFVVRITNVQKMVKGIYELGEARMISRASDAYLGAVKDKTLGDIEEKKK